MMKLFSILSLLFLISIGKAQELEDTMDEAIEMACGCAKAVQKKIDKRLAKGKNINFNVPQAAHDCAQDALTEYSVAMMEEIDAIPHNAQGLDNHKYIEQVFNSRVSAECKTLVELLQYQKK